MHAFSRNQARNERVYGTITKAAQCSKVASVPQTFNNWHCLKAPRTCYLPRKGLRHNEQCVLRGDVLEKEGPIATLCRRGTCLAYALSTRGSHQGL